MLEERTLRAAGRWLGIGVAAGPILQIADNAGWIVAFTSLEPSSQVWPAAQMLLFAALGFAAAWLLPRHRPRGRTLFFALCALPVGAWVFVSGLTISSVVAVLALALALAQLRLTGHLPPIPPAPRYDGASGDVP